MRARARRLAFLTLRCGPTPSVCQRSLVRSRRCIDTTFCLVSIGLVIAAVGCRSRQSQIPVQSASSGTTVPQIASRSVPGKRVIFIGLDGADWSLLDQYVARGVMPTLAKLVAGVERHR